MIGREPGSGTPALRALLPARGYAWRRAFAVLDGRSRGRVFTDDPERPSWVAVQEFSDDSALFFGGVVDRALAREVIARSRRGRGVTVGLAEGDPLAALLPRADHERIDVEYEHRDPAVDLESLVVPALGLRLARIDDTLVGRTMWPPWMCSDEASALRDGVGFCLLDGERVVSEAFAGPVVDGALEMATITDPAYQRRGLATIVCARAVLECERQGYVTWWNTSLRNAGSRGVARRLGYGVERHYHALSWLAAPEG